MPAREPTLVLVPTEMERRWLVELGGLPPGLGALELSGFGPVSAAARTAQLLGERRPRRVLLVGIAGSLDALTAPVGTARCFARVLLEGVGVGMGEAFRPASSLGFAQWHDEAIGPIEEVLPLASPSASAPRDAGALLTVCAASGSRAEAAARRARHPAGVAEDMEGFGVALACRLRGIPLLCVRGLSNTAGERERGAWCVREALAAARQLALECLARDEWSAP